MKNAAPALTLLLFACLGPPRFSEHLPPPPRIGPEALAHDIGWLADDAREGRGLGTAGLEASARYLADGFRSAGLAPAGDDGSYLQRFEMPVAVLVAKAELEIEGEILSRPDLDAFLTSASGEAEGEVVFVGHGLTDSAEGWDDYAGIDVAGRVVLILDEPPETKALSAGHRRPARSRARTFLNARKHGAAAALLAPSSANVTGLPGGAGDEMTSPTLSPSGLLTLAISRRTAERIVAAAGGPSLAQRQAAIRRSGSPEPALLPGVRVRVSARIDRREGSVANVIAVRRGSDPLLASEAVVIGAHYDHIGRGEFGSLAPDRRGEIHNGANDNASGAAGLLALARVLGQGPAPARSLVLIGFTGEEAGLVGSAHYVDHPSFPIDDTVAMINLDMIGRLGDNALTVFGTDSSKGFSRLVRDAAGEIPLEVTAGAFSPSDQTSFRSRGVPVLFFFTGTHPEYHGPDDDVAGIDGEGEARVLSTVYRVAWALASAPERPSFTGERAAYATGAVGGPRGYGPYLGTVPAFGSSPTTGVELQAVRSGSPAERAGLQAGDVIVRFAGTPVANLEEFALLLREARAGESVEIVVMRSGEAIETRAVLGTRR